MIPEDLRNLTNPIYIIDREYKIVDFNNGYERFAIENEGEDILHKWPIGSNILSSIPDIIRSKIKKMYDDVIIRECSIFCVKGDFFQPATGESGSWGQFREWAFKHARRRI